jgi:putative heme-binding domain-containing protein
MFTLIFGCMSAAASAESQTNVYMLVPGFTVQELPLRLPNINNLRFAPDGRLFALGYDGRVHVLRDTNGDGLEDQSEIFWGKPTIRVPVGMAWSRDGLYISSQGKVSLLKDTDRDGKADVEEIIASGWAPTDVKSGGVDASAVTLDEEGNIYFGLLTADYSNPYRLKDGVSHYDLNGQRGTIQKWSKATRKLETIATGIRVPYTLAFNKRGDLFVTDQEGETWCPNGNPLDEFNHIIPGRNYGFPPRHEKYLPNLISEPPVIGFGPQHQSACGFVFNEPKKGQGLFGPTWWRGDAFVAGESRGKIWRVRLVQTPQGYVGKETIIARLNMLTTDVAISPKGELYVSCHSGPPDWGTGPQGVGKLFKITYADTKAPQPVAAWAVGLQEVRLAFDRSIDASVTHDLVGRQIEFGDYVRAGDRYEVLKPPYKVVEQQEATPRGKLKIVAAKLEPDQRVLVLTTDPHPQAVTYAMTIPGVKANGKAGPGETVDVDYDLSGVTGHFAKGHWSGKLPYGREVMSGLNLQTPFKDQWQGWFPSADRSTADKLIFPLQPWHEAERKAKPGRGDAFLMQFRLNLPLAGLTLHARSRSPVELYIQTSATTAESEWPLQRDPDGRFSISTRLDSFPTTFPTPGSVTLLVKDGSADIELSYSYKEDRTRRAFSPRQLINPFYQGELAATALRTNTILEARASPSLDVAGGDWHRGKALFASEQLKCATCHRVRNEGADIGPDLSNLIHRDVASVLRDIREPNASINPDFVAYNVSLRSGEELNGFIRAQGEDRLRLLTADGKETILARADLETIKPSSVSLMPTGLLDGLNEGQVRDLLTFLITEGTSAIRESKPQTAPLGSDNSSSSATPPRRRVEVEAALAKTANLESELRNLKLLQIVLIASKQDHGPGEHDYPAWQTNWTKLLGDVDAVKVSTAWQWPSPEQFQQADVLVFYYWNHSWTPERYRQLDDYLARGGGMVLLHSSCIADTEPEPLAERIGLSAQPKRTKYRHGALDLKILTQTDHPITGGLPKQIHFVDETYWPMIGDTNKVEVLATAEEEGQEWPMFWTFQKGKGRVFGSILGHYSRNYDDPFFRILVLRGLAWVTQESPARFQSLATRGMTLGNSVR